MNSDTQDSASILIADDEESFRESTSRLLQREGYRCDCAEDAEEAIKSLEKSHFDVLIADIRMPHNQDMRLVQKAHDLDREMAVIVATGYPSTDTAIRSVEMPVTAYLTKPLDFDELLQHVQAALKLSVRRRTLSGVVERLTTCLADLETMQSQPPHSIQANEKIQVGTIRTLAACLSELLTVSAKAAPRQSSNNLCALLDCPQQPVHRKAILHAIEVLKETKDTFKSRQLAALRNKLERLIYL
jgi:DNA-binding response OmpR family regulator